MTTLCNYIAVLAVLIPVANLIPKKFSLNKRGCSDDFQGEIIVWATLFLHLFSLPSIPISALGNWRVVTCSFTSSFYVWLHGCSVPLQKPLCFRERWSGAGYTALCSSRLPRYTSEIRDWGCFWWIYQCLLSVQQQRYTCTAPSAAGASNESPWLWRVGRQTFISLTLAIYKIQLWSHCLVPAPSVPGGEVNKSLQFQTPLSGWD